MKFVFNYGGRRMNIRFPKKKAYLKNANWFVKVAYYTGMGYFVDDAKKYGSYRYIRTFKCRWYHPLYWCFGFIFGIFQLIGIMLVAIPDYLTQKVEIDITDEMLDEDDYEYRRSKNFAKKEEGGSY